MDGVVHVFVLLVSKQQQSGNTQDEHDEKIQSPPFCTGHSILPVSTDTHRGQRSISPVHSHSVKTQEHMGAKTPTETCGK